MYFADNLNPINSIRDMAKMHTLGAVRFFFQRYWHAFLFLLYLALMGTFGLLEKFIIPQYWLGCYLDQYIPFWPAFIVPYILWFPLVAAILIALCFSDRGDFTRTIMLLFAGMTVAMVVFAIFPHAQSLRPQITSNDFFSRAVRYSIYANDTNTNCFPSIHVLNQLAVHIGLCKSRMCRGRKWIKNTSLILTILVCASTVFIKQHSIIDVAAALVIEVLLYMLVFKVSWLQFVPATIRQFSLRMSQKWGLQGDFSCLETTSAVAEQFLK